METTKTILILMLILFVLFILALSIFFFNRRKETLRNKQKLEEIYELNKKFIKNSQKSSELRMSIMDNAKLTRIDLYNLNKILEEEISLLTLLIGIINENECKIAYGKKKAYSDIVVLAAKDLLNERLIGRRLKIGSGYTPYYPGHKYAYLIEKTLFEYRQIIYSNVEEKSFLLL